MLMLVLVGMFLFSPVVSSSAPGVLLIAVLLTNNSLALSFGPFFAPCEF